MSSPQLVRPRNFFLNESHELSSIDKSGGGRIPEYAGISWAQKSARISSSISTALNEISASNDPLREERFFVVANPEITLTKRSVNQKKAPEGTFSEPTSFGGVHGKVFDRLGLDLLQVTSDGKAVVHGSRERVAQLLSRSKALESLGSREQVRWATIESFETIPFQLRVDGDWLAGLKNNQPADVVFELQPVLGRVEADRILRAVGNLLTRSGENITGTGTDFSGRFWFRGKASVNSIRAIAKDFFSVQAIHSPLYSLAAAAKKSSANRTSSVVSVGQTNVDVKALPCVAVVDLGVPVDHVCLGPFKRGQFVPQGASNTPPMDHGSFVASRIVFGDHDSAQGLEDAVGQCSFYDAVVGDGYMDRINDKLVMDAIRGVRGAAPDVRVFNLSFGDARPLSAFPDVEQREKRLLMQDLDNFAFANDVAIVVAAGNSKRGIIPNPLYPNHHTDSQWALGPWACGFNTLVCGAYVGHVSSGGLVTTVGWPSPFSRIGPGLCESPVPTFGAPGGNSDTSYGSNPGLGVWGFSDAGLAEDRIGTSHAAPILARETAFAFARLQQHCIGGTQPFAVTVRAFLALTATRTTTDSGIFPLAERTLGFGRASAHRLSSPSHGSATILWQGIIESSKDIVRVQVPIPQSWLQEADDPILRMVVSYDPPVNESATALWACRKVHATLHPGPEARGLRGTRSHDTYPLFYREYKLARYAPGEEKASGVDLWVLEVAYEDIFDYPPGMDFDPRQRVAIAAELIDRGATPIDPQAAIQLLPAAIHMNRLSIHRAPVRNPVIVRSRA